MSKRDEPLPVGVSTELVDRIKSEVAQEFAKLPTIALIGEAGVGKTTTINSLFNQGLPTHDIIACTQEAHELTVDVQELHGRTGRVKIYDMPGLGEDIDKDEKHLRTYEKVLPLCDVVVWILDGRTKTFTNVQLALRNLLGASLLNIDQLVVGINKIDEIHPGDWVVNFNLPSVKQEANIALKLSDVKEKLAKVSPSKPIAADRFVPYSALHWYHLGRLFNAMLDAAPIERAWALYQRSNVADQLQKIDPVVREDVRRLLERELGESALSSPRG